MANPDIGTVICYLTGEVAPVRRDKNGKLYYVSSAGMIKPNSQTGQKWMREHAKLDGETRNEETPQKPVTEKPHDHVININHEPVVTPPVTKNSWGLFS